jgi:AraC family transcriptional regulator
MISETMASPAERTLNQSSLYTATRPASEYHPQAPLHPDLVDCSTVAFSAPEIGTHRFATWPGLRVETVQGMRPTPFEYGFRAPWHLLIPLRSLSATTIRLLSKACLDRPCAISRAR